MKYTLKILSGSEDIEDAVQSIRSFNYFREITQEEIKSSAFIEIGNKAGWMWLQWMSHEYVSGHILIHPEHRRRAITRHVIVGAQWMAEFMGATRLYALNPGDLVTRYLKRLHWQTDEHGLFIQLR